MRASLASSSFFLFGRRVSSSRKVSAAPTSRAPRMRARDPRGHAACARRAALSSSPMRPLRLPRPGMLRRRAPFSSCPLRLAHVLSGLVFSSLVQEGSRRGKARKGRRAPGGSGLFGRQIRACGVVRGGRAFDPGSAAGRAGAAGSGSPAVRWCWRTESSATASSTSP